MGNWIKSMKVGPLEISGTHKVGAAGKESARAYQSDVADLPDEKRRLVEQMLVEGAPFEDVVDAVNERDGDGVTLTAVENFFRGDLELQKRRARHQVESVQALKQSLGDPDSAEGQLAAAALFTGFLGLNRKSAELNLKDAERLRLLRENLSLRNRLLRLRGKREVQLMAYTKARIKLELAKWELAKGQITKLYRELQAPGQEARLGPETLQKIQEIYGLISLPQVPSDAARR